MEKQEKISENLRMLVAEDEPNDAFFLKRAFLKAGINVPMDFVGDGQEAVDYLSGEGRFEDRRSHPLPSLLLLDIKMPRLSGFDVLKWLRQQPGLRRLAVLVFSSSDDQRDINLAYDLGANSYATKPAAAADLVEFALCVQKYWFKRHRYPDCQPEKVATSR